MSNPARSWCLQHRILPPHAQHAARVPGGIGRVIGCNTFAGDVIGWTVLIGGVTRQFVPRDVKPMRRLTLVPETPNEVA